MLVMLDDAKSKSDATMTELKSILSESHVVLEKKYEAERTVEIFSRIIFASNEYRPLRLDPDERRWYVPRRIEHSESRAETQSLIDSLEDWLDAGGLDVGFGAAGHRFYYLACQWQAELRLSGGRFYPDDSAGWWRSGHGGGHMADGDHFIGLRDRYSGLPVCLATAGAQ